jgi:hypothetical protein
MPGVEKQGDAASCGSHQNTGSPTVFIEEKGMTRVNIDTAGGLIIGPGAQTVFLEGYKASLKNDAIIAHGRSPHNAAKTLTTNPTVFAETGFREDPGEGDVPKSDLNTSVFADSGGPYMANVGTCPVKYWYKGNITFKFTISNTGNGPAGSFKVGLWELPITETGVSYILPRNSTGVIDGTYPFLLAEKSIGGVPEGGQITDTIVLPSGSWNQSSAWDLVVQLDNPRVFILYVDLDNDVGEPNENNSTPAIEINATYYCP